MQDNCPKKCEEEHDSVDHVTQIVASGIVDQTHPGQQNQDRALKVKSDASQFATVARPFHCYPSSLSFTNV